MSLLLCRQEDVRHPFYMEAMGLHLYSSQELSYVIYNHPLLVLDGFLGEELLAFLRDELNQGFLALKLERWGKSRENKDEALVMILQECGYYTSAEIGRFRQRIKAIRKKHPAEYRKAKADELFLMGQYGRASKIYQELLEYPADRMVNEMFIGRVWNNLAACHMRMFRFSQAMEEFERAYLRTGKQQVVEQMYELTLLDDSLKLESQIEAQVTEEMREICEKRVKESKEKASQSPLVRQIDELYQFDSVKRQAGIGELLYRWKKDYRSMV